MLPTPSTRANQSVLDYAVGHLSQSKLRTLDVLILDPTNKTVLTSCFPKADSLCLGTQAYYDNRTSLRHCLLLNTPAYYCGLLLIYIGVRSCYCSNRTAIVNSIDAARAEINTVRVEEDSSSGTGCSSSKEGSVLHRLKVWKLDRCPMMVSRLLVGDLPFLRRSQVGRSSLDGACIHLDVSDTSRRAVSFFSLDGQHSKA